MWIEAKEFWVPGIPTPWKAARVRRGQGGYTPITVADRHWRSIFISESYKHLPEEPLCGPVKVDTIFLMPRPKRLMRKKDDAGEIYCDRQPDVGNLRKLVLDMMEPSRKNPTYTGFYDDDKRVCEGREAQYYCALDGDPGVRIIISKWF
mgnify:CR=1 FL=1